MRSYADSGHGRRSKFYLQRAPGNTMDDDAIVTVVREQLRVYLLAAHIVWESMYELDAASIVVYSSSPHDMWGNSVQRIMRGATFVTKSRIICSIMGAAEEKERSTPASEKEVAVACRPRDTGRTRQQREERAAPAASGRVRVNN